MAGPDYRAGRLVVVVTWDEGDSDNHIPTLVISPTTRQITVGRRLNQCDLLRTEQELLRLTPLLGCAASATSVAAEFRL
jgi:hypothetical protein